MMNLGVLFVWSFLLGSITTSVFMTTTRLSTIASLLREIRQELEWARRTRAGL